MTFTVTLTDQERKELEAIKNIAGLKTLGDAFRLCLNSTVQNVVAASSRGNLVHQKSPQTGFIGDEGQVKQQGMVG